MSHYRIRVALIGTFCQLLWLMTCAMPLDAFAAGKDLESLVAPIALYPDPLLAQVLAASTNPGQVDAANTWVAAHSNVTGDALTKAVAKNNWDPSVKELTHFPGVLSKMSSNRAWSSALGAAYTNDPGAVMSAVQSLRHRAKDAGKLSTNTEMKVVESKQNIVIQSASPQTVYVPSYNPTAVYGQPVAAYPGYSGTDMALSNMVSFGTESVWVLWHLGKNGWGVNWGKNGSQQEQGLQCVKSQLAVRRHQAGASMMILTWGTSSLTTLTPATWLPMAVSAIIRSTAMSMSIRRSTAVSTNIWRRMAMNTSIWGPMAMSTTIWGHTMNTTWVAADTWISRRGARCTGTKTPANISIWAETNERTGLRRSRLREILRPD